MASTTVLLPASRTVLVASGGTFSLVTPTRTITRGNVEVSTRSDSALNLDITMASGFALYFPVTIPPNSAANIDVAALVDDETTLVNRGGGEAPQSAYKPLENGSFSSFELDAIIPLTGPATLYVPHNAILPTRVDVDASADALQNQITITAVSTSIMTSSPYAPPSDSSQTSGSSKASFDVAVLAGGIVGAFLLGVLLALVAFFIFTRRRKSQQQQARFGAKANSSSSPSTDGMYTENTQIPMKSMGVTTWEKHLPQEKDDKSIATAVKSMFEQVQIHVEGFYSAKAQRQGSEQIESLEVYTSDNLSKLLGQADNPLPLLEGVLLRWIVHRVSLRSTSSESLLPVEYTKIPEQNKWHMEADSQGEGMSSSSRRGSSEAFSKWRVLTGFLRPGPGNDQEYQEELDKKIEKSVRTLANAMSPWVASGQIDANRLESLRQILQQASIVGLLVFAQPSSFIFDWSADERTPNSTVVIAPAFVRKSDDQKGPLHLVQPLVKAKRIEKSRL